MYINDKQINQILFQKWKSVCTNIYASDQKHQGEKKYEQSIDTYIQKKIPVNWILNMYVDI